MEEQRLLANKVVLITGGTGGIGLETAYGLAMRGATVVITGRDRVRAEMAVARLRVETGAVIEPLLADLSEQAEVRRLAVEVLERWPRLDILVNNAGGFFWKREETNEGIERTWALNHLSYFLLTNLLLPALERGAAEDGDARVVNVASNAHYGGRIHWDDPQMRRGYSGWAAYGQSKLANIMFTFELSRRLEGTGITTNSLHPGFVASNFAKNNGRLIGLGMALLHRFAITPTQGAATSIYLAASKDLCEVSGGYYTHSRPARAAALAYDAEKCARLWAMTEGMVKEM